MGHLPTIVWAASGPHFDPAPSGASMHFQQIVWENLKSVAYPWSRVVDRAFSLEFGDPGSNSNSCTNNLAF